MKIAVWDFYKVVAGDFFSNWTIQHPAVCMMEGLHSFVAF